MHIIGLFIFIGLIILILGIAILSKIIHFVTSVIQAILHPFTPQQKSEQQSANYTDHTASNNSQSTSSTKSKTKYFDHDDGEYVEFEEIKD